MPIPELKPAHVLRVHACGVCRADRHIVGGELLKRRRELIPDHQIVGEIVDGATADLPRGTRISVSPALTAMPSL